MAAAAPGAAVAGSSSTFEPPAEAQPEAVKQAFASSRNADAQSGSHSKTANAFVHPPGMRECGSRAQPRAVLSQAGYAPDMRVPWHTRAHSISHTTKT